MRLIKYSCCEGCASGEDRRRREKYKDIAEDSIVMPRSCSSGRESRYRILPASLGDIMPFVAMSASVREVLPWSYSTISTECGAVVLGWPSQISTRNETAGGLIL